METKILKPEELSSVSIQVRGFASLAKEGDIIEVPKKPKFGLRTIQIQGNSNPITYPIIERVKFNGEVKDDQSISFITRGEKADRPEAIKLVGNCTNLEEIAEKIPGTRWQCVKVIEVPFKNVTWELISNDED